MVKKKKKNLPATQENPVQFLGRDRLPTPIFLGFPGGSDGKQSTCNAEDLGQEDPLEEDTATLSSILAWKIPWTEKPGGLQSVGSPRVGHD